MSRLSKEDVLKLAKLARLSLTDDEVKQFASEITAILEYVEQLQTVDLQNTEPTFQVTGLTNVTRPDEIRNYGTTVEGLLKNAPATDLGNFKVRRML